MPEPRTARRDMEGHVVWLWLLVMVLEGTRQCSPGIFQIEFQEAILQQKEGRKDGRREGKALSGQRKLSLQQRVREGAFGGSTCSLALPLLLLRSISWQWHRSRRLQKSCNNVTNFSVVGALSLSLSFCLPRCCQNSFRLSCPLSCSFSSLPSSVVRPVLHEMGSWMDTLVLGG